MSETYVTRPDGTKTEKAQKEPKEKKPIPWGWIIGSFIVGVIFSQLFMTGGSETTPEVKEEVKAEAEVKAEVKEEPKKEEPKENNNDYYAVGETAEYKGFEMTLLGYTESEGGDWGKPKEGNVFVYPEFEASNGTDEEVTIATMAGSFEVYYNDYKVDASSEAMTYASTEHITDIGGSIAPGKKNKGVYNMLELPKDWDKVEILYYDNMFKDATFTFVLEK